MKYLLSIITAYYITYVNLILLVKSLVFWRAVKIEEDITNIYDDRDI